MKYIYRNAYSVQFTIYEVGSPLSPIFFIQPTFFSVYYYVIRLTCLRVGLEQSSLVLSKRSNLKLLLLYNSLSLCCLRHNLRVKARGLQGAHSAANSQWSFSIASSAVQRAIAQPARLTRYFTRFIGPSTDFAWEHGWTVHSHVRRERRDFIVWTHGFASHLQAPSKPVWGQPGPSGHSHPDFDDRPPGFSTDETGNAKEPWGRRRETTADELWRQGRSVQSHLQEVKQFVPFVKLTDEHIQLPAWLWKIFDDNFNCFLTYSCSPTIKKLRNESIEKYLKIKIATKAATST